MQIILSTVRKISCVNKDMILGYNSVSFHTRLIHFDSTGWIGHIEIAQSPIQKEELILDLTNVLW